MPLIAFWKSERNAVQGMTIKQLTSIAGEGKPTDSSICQNELRLFFKEVPTDFLATYGDYCLEPGFENSGYVLQDIVNELGRRLDYAVENGRYRGSSGAIGFDGIWEDPDKYSIVIEVKTTDAYRISLETVTGYRQKLINSKRISENSSILIVVGRTDSGELEAQVRGSKHAWDVRIIGIDSLISLVRVKESAENPETIQKIKTLLMPVEYTRLDNLIDVVFATAKDIRDTVEEFVEDDIGNGVKITHRNDRTSNQVISETRDATIQSISERLDQPLLKRTRTLFNSPDGKTRVACSVSKRYERPGVVKYWYAYHKGWHQFLEEGDVAYMALGCVDSGFAFLLPRDLIVSALKNLNHSEREGGVFYWHLKISEPETGVFFLQVPSPEAEDIPLKEYIIPIITKL